jgi:hypothetical protein
MSVLRNLCAFALICSLATTLSARAANAIQTGYVIVTPTDGIQGGLIVFGNLSLTSGTQLTQGVFAARPLVNAAALPITGNQATAENTGIAIVNPNTQSVSILLVLRSASPGSAPLTQNLTLGAGQQSAQFVNQMFPKQDIPQGFPAVLTMVANLPVGVVGFNFQGSNFSAVPVTDLTTVLNPSALALLNSDVANGINSNTTNTTNGVNGVASTASASSSGITPNSLQSATIGGMPVFTSTSNSTEQFFPLVANGVGGNGALILPQFASNGGWSTVIRIVNSSSVQRTVRTDFFDVNGTALNVQFQNGSGSSFTNIIIPAFGSVELTPINTITIAIGTTTTNPTNGVNGTPGTTGTGTGATSTTTTATTNGVNGLIGM